MKSKQNVRHYLFDVEMLRRRLLRPYFIELGLTVGQGQPRILYELRKWNEPERIVRCLPYRGDYDVKNA